MTASASEMQVNLNESKQASLRTLLIAALVTPTIVVFFRVWSRALLPVSPTSNIKSRFWWDDYTVLAAAIINIVISVIGLKLVDLGLGLHIEAIPPGNIDYLLKLLWFTYVLFDWGSTLAKASAIFFYIRILGAASSRFKTSLWLLHGLNLLWLVVILIVTLLLCSPIEKNWNTTVPGRCINPTTLWLGNGASGLVIDLIILFIPLPVLWGLQMKLSRKLQTTVVFLVGYIVVVVSIGRVVNVARSGDSYFKDPSYNFTPLAMWLGSEIPVAIISVSLPSIFFLAQRLFRQGFKSLFTTQSLSVSSQTVPSRYSYHQKADDSDFYDKNSKLPSYSQDSLRGIPQTMPMTYPMAYHSNTMPDTHVHPLAYYHPTTASNEHVYPVYPYVDPTMANTYGHVEHYYPVITTASASYGGSDDEYTHHGIQVKSDIVVV